MKRSAGRRFVVRSALAAALASALACAAAWPAAAHEGHGGVPPVLREVRVGAERWLIGLGVVPADPVAGEQLHIELKAAALDEVGSGERAAAADQVRLSIEGADVALRPANTPGVLAASYRAERAGALRLNVEVRTAGAVAAETFRVDVRAGPAQRLRPFVVAAFLLPSAMAALALWRRRRPAPPVDTRALVPWIAGVGACVVGVIAFSSFAVTPILAERFLPDRQPSAVDWIVEAPAVVMGTPGARAGVAPQAGAETPPGLIAGRVVAAPDRVADVIVPMPGRVLPLENNAVRLGHRVTKGQKLATLQPTYIMHDALHLINLRWPILQSMIDAKRRMIEARTEVERLKLVLAEGVVSVNEVQAAEAAAAAAEQDFERWNRTLAMHDVQIGDDQPKLYEFSAPISGRIAAANFTQGQRVYEGDPLFTVVDLSTVWIEARVPEQWLSRFGGRTVEFTAAADPSLTVTGRLQKVAAQIDPETRTLSHFYAVDNPRELLRIGMLVHARLRANGGGVVPTSAR